MTFLLIVTVTSMLLAAIMSVIAWRLACDEGRRSDARVAALAAEIHESEGDVGWVPLDPPHAAHVHSDPHVGRVLSEPPQNPPQSRAQAPSPKPRRSAETLREGGKDPAYRGDLSDPELTYSTLFTAPKPRSGARPLATLLVGIVTVGAVAAMAVVRPRILTRAPRVAPTAAALPSPLPLELVALGHERVGDQLTVRGVVRNPPTGTAIDRLTAVVFVVAPDGEYLATGRSAVEAPALQPGREATFAVTVPGAGDVSRYRVSFRTGDRLVPHLDRRHEG